MLSRFTLQAARATSARHAATPALRIGGVELEYGARSNSLVFERTYLDRQLPHANPITVSMCEQMCRRLLDARRARVGTSTMVRHYLNAGWDGRPLSLEEVARMMSTSTRTLKRRLQEDGTTFRALLNESRSAMAETLLSDVRLTLTEIAERLGYSDLSSFSQAFKRWYGVAPQVYRVELAGGWKEKK